MVMARNRAFVLLVVLPILGLLALLGSVFVAVSMAEVRVTKGYVAKTRSRMIAWGGIERAVAELRDHALKAGFDSPKDAWVFRNNNGVGGDAPGHGTILDDRQPPPVGYVLAQNPSLKASAPTYPALAGGVGFQYSGLVGGSYVESGDYYLLKILDCASMFNLNSPDKVSPDAAGTPNKQPDFAAMWNNLVNDIRTTYPGLAGSIPAGDWGDKVLNLRTALGGQFRSKAELKLITGFGVALTDQGYRALADFVTVQGWRDLDVVGACPDAAFPPGDANKPMVLRTERDEVAKNINPPFRGRYPIDVNTAPHPVLMAALQGINGTRLVPKGYGQVVAGQTSAQLVQEQIPGLPLAQAQANLLANAIMTQRENVSPFRTWEEFQLFLWNPDTGALAPGVATPEIAMAIIANANPNTRNARCNPNLAEAGRRNAPYDATFASTDFLVDKLGLTNQTTEFCFSGMGYYEIESVGRVMESDGAGGLMPNESRLTAILKIYDVLRHTSQRDFVGSMPGAIITNNNTSGTAAFSAQLRVCGYYPEAPNDKPDAEYGSPYDGSVQLSTEWEADIGGFPSLRYQAYYRKSLAFVDPPAGGNPASMVSVPPDKTEAYTGSGNSPATGTPSVFSGANLLEDGVVTWSRGNGQVIGGYGASGSGKHLVYDPGAMLTQSSGTIEFWVKLGTMQGSNEVLMAAVTPTIQGNAEGLAWRLERYGTTLISTRFYWFNPPQQNSRAAYPEGPGNSLDPDKNGIVYQEASADISGWRAGEWHKIRHIWPDPAAPQPNELVSHQTFVDGVAMANTLVMNRDKKLPDPEGSFTLVTTCGYTDHTGGNNWGYACWDVPTGTATYQANLFQLKSLPATFALFVGGYLYNQGNASIMLQGAPGKQVTFGATSNRFTNSTIDEVRFFQNTTAPATSTNRYAIGGGTHTGNFGNSVVIPAAALARRPLPPGALFGTLGFTAYLPTQYAGNVVNFAPPAVGLSWVGNGGPTENPAAGVPLGLPLPVYANNPANRQVSSDPATADTTSLQYTLTFAPGLAGGNAVTTPIVDDVTLTVVGTPAMVDFTEDVGQ